jgi:hypothetical protein
VSVADKSLARCKGRNGNRGARGSSGRFHFFFIRLESAEAGFAVKLIAR